MNPASVSVGMFVCENAVHVCLCLVGVVGGTPGEGLCCRGFSQRDTHRA